ncbi:hypothetical protein EUGRSUZ_K02819 [Eucalyptus grandis]|uniref:Uncharacterized protein n=2 Tax=Eucalyptus grandis TaxID=71139 RepID=A0ACC3IXL1_EUCGR|nr:hypothetical protein EUGRSUZ_K02819 [Eucalyptus grandis]
MEWEVYYEDYLMFKTKSMNEDGTYRAAAIIDHDGKVWTQTSNFPQLTTEERITIMREFDEPGTLTTIGLYLGGTKYVVIGVEPGDAIRAHKLALPPPLHIPFKFPFGALTNAAYSTPITSPYLLILLENLLNILDTLFVE